MSEEHVALLLSAELDGEIDDSERARLAEYLLAHPGARQLQDEFRALDALLAGMPSVQPPADLRDRIIAETAGSIATRTAGPPPAVVPARKSKPETAPVYQLWPASLKPLLAAAAVIVVAIGLVTLGPGTIRPSQVEHAAGTMVKPRAPIESLAIEGSGFSASVNLVPLEDGMGLSIKLLTTAETATIIELPANRYELVPGGDQARSRGVVLHGNTLEVSSTGAFETEVMLRRVPGSGAPGGDKLTLRMERDGELIHRATLAIPAEVKTRGTAD